MVANVTALNVFKVAGIMKKIEILFRIITRDKTQSNRQKKMAYAIHIKLEELEKENVLIREENASILKDNASILKDNAELRQIIAAYAGQIERNKAAICQLFGGLYNPIEQKRILNEHLNTLIGCEEEDDDDASDISDDDEDIWPTTRQGDEHSKRLKESEERLRILAEQVAAMEKRQLEKLALME